MGKDYWMKQFIEKNYSTPEQRGRAAAWFLKLEILVYIMIFLGLSIFIIKMML